MSGGRPRTAIGTYGAVYVLSTGGRCVAETRFRDADGRLRKVTATADSPSGARALLKERLLNRPGYGSGGALSLSSSFADLAALWLADLDLRELAPATKQSYRDQLRLHVFPAFEHYSLGEITTGRVEWFLKSQATVSHSRAKQSRTLLNLLFAFALRHDGMPRNPVEGTSPLPKPKGTPRALSLAQIGAIRAAAASWRTEPGLPGPKPDGQVRDIIEVLLGTGLRRHLLRTTPDRASLGSARDGEDVHHRIGHQHPQAPPGSLTARPATSAVEGPHACGRQPALQR